MGETKPILPKKKGELVSVDYYGPLPVSTGGIKYLFVVVDNFTKYVKLYAIRRATTTTALRRIQQYIHENGKPQSILSDNGTQFTSGKWIKGLQELNITPKFTAIRNPYTNIAERWNRQLGNLFRVFVKEKHTKWASYLKHIETCLNEVYQETIEMTPYEAHFGNKPTRAWEKYLDECVLNKAVVDSNKIYLRIKEKSERQARRINKISKLSEFSIGDKVLIRANYVSDATQNIISKFCALYEGPYEVMRKIGKTTYELNECQDKTKIRGIFNIRQLKKYYSHSLA